MLKGLPIVACLFCFPAFAQDFAAWAAEQPEEPPTEEALMRAKCGAEYGKIHIGMSAKQLMKCVEILDVKYKDARAAVYEVQAGYVRVDGGKVTRWIAK